MALSLPVIFALGGVALIALAALGPRKTQSDPAVSFAPPITSDRARWARPRGWYPPYPSAARPTPSSAPPPQPTWTDGIDAHAGPCDATTRMALIEALTALHTEWSEAVLRRALVEESDPAIREAAFRALARDAVPADDFTRGEHVFARHEFEFGVRGRTVEALQ
jgi:hypothetical protein